MNKNEIILKREIMARVRFIYSIKKAVQKATPKFLVLAVMISAGSFFVSVPNVLNNMPSISEAPKFFEFATSAFVNTNFLTQAICLGIAVALFYATRDILRAFRLQQTRPLSVAQ